MAPQLLKPARRTAGSQVLVRKRVLRSGPPRVAVNTQRVRVGLGRLVDVVAELVGEAACRGMASIQTLDRGTGRERHVVRYKDEQGKNRGMTFALRNEAKAFLAEVARQEQLLEAGRQHATPAIRLHGTGTGPHRW